VAGPTDIRADLGKDNLRGGCTNSGDVGEVDAGNAVGIPPVTASG
jgi:hypothetical protein